MACGADPVGEFKDCVQAPAAACYGGLMAITHRWVHGQIVVCDTVADYIDALEDDLPIVAPEELAAAFGFADLPDELSLLDECLPPTREHDCLPSDN